MKKVIIVTRHAGLVEFLAEQGIHGHVIEHATIEDVKNNIVYGVLPLHLAAYAKCVVSCDMNIPQEKRGKELTLEDVKTYFTGFQTYRIQKFENPEQVDLFESALFNAW